MSQRHEPGDEEQEVMRDLRMFFWALVTLAVTIAVVGGLATWLFYRTQ